MNPQTDPGEKYYFAAFNDFAKRCPELARDLLGRILDDAVRLNSRIIREITTMVALAVAFELLNRNLVGEASAFGFKAAKLGFLRYWVPIAIGFLLFRICSIIRDRNFTLDVAEAICAQTYPELTRSGLLSVITPGIWISTASNPPEALIERKAFVYRQLTASVEFAVTFFIIPFGFTGYAIIQLFRQSEPPYIAPIIATVLTTALVVAAYMIFFMSESEIKIPPPMNGSRSSSAVDDVQSDPG
jgi:hypothetical protein